jgi:hypothetical protein
MEIDSMENNNDDNIMDYTQNVDTNESIEQKLENPSETTSPNDTNNIMLELGDIVEINAPNNKDIHEVTAYITYIDKNKIITAIPSEDDNVRVYQFNITQEGYFSDETIKQIIILSRSEEKGYARQNGLLPGKWLDIYFGGEIPVIITGEITNLDEDMIELTTYPELNTIYINFGYRGIPENIPIEKIILREKPASLKKDISLALVKQQLDERDLADIESSSDELATMEFTESGESIIQIPSGAIADENIKDTLHNLYIDANSIVFGKKLEPIAQLIEVPEGEQRYGIDIQINDLMDELLSTIPNSQRSKQVLDNIHNLIERFKELRSMYSKFDNNQNAYDLKMIGALHKPLIEHIIKIDRNLKWIVPVVTNRRKIYDDEILLEIPDTINEKFGSGARKIESSQLDKTLDYSTKNNLINEFITPYEDTLEIHKLVGSVNVLENIDSIVDNLGDFYSSVYTRSGVIKRKFVIQRYNLGLSKLDQVILNTGKPNYVRVQMTPNDKMDIKSMLIMPEPIIRYSSINLPTTNILEKATLHQNPLMLFRLLRKNTDITQHVIDDLSKKFDYEKMEEETQKEFFSTFNHFVFDEDISADIEKTEKFQNFLEIIIPKTRVLIRLIRKYIKDKISFLDVVKKLEPFTVYPSDISYKQYMEIRYLIKTKIKEFKTEYEKRYNIFSNIRNYKYNIVSKPNPILKLLSERSDFIDSFFQTYKFLSIDKEKTTLSSQEILFKMIEIDNGNLYTNLVTSILISLMSPNNLMDIISEPNIDNISDTEKIKPTDCSRRYLAKKYTSIRDLQKDNNIDEVYYDKDYDDTPYDILNKYKDDQKRMAPELFLDFLALNLIKKHDCPENIANELAATLISKKKLVSDGEYAILEIKPKLPSDVDESDLSVKEKISIDEEANIRKKTDYYRRVKNNWVRDNSIGEETFFDNNTLFCNISSECFKNTKNNVCETISDASARMKEISKKKMMDEFDKRYSVNVEELERELENKINYYIKNLNKTRILKEIQLYKANNIAFELGNLANAIDIIESPYMKLRDLILGQEDFSKKQFDICRFVDNFCRAPMVEQLDENAYWLYCKDTNIKLIPSSLYELAKTFITGDNYLNKLAEICHNIGILSDDGDSIVDKHSGFVLRKIDFSTEEGFDESGFHITSHDILEKDLGTAVSELINKPEKRVFENEEMESIYNVLSTICTNIDIPIDSIEEFVMRLSRELITANVLSESSYKKRADKLEKEKGKKSAPYKDYRNETIIIIIACVTLITIQTATPSFQSKRSFPGCVRSFSGYPMDGMEDLTGVKYIACVLDKSKSTISIWGAIKKYNADVLAKRMKDIIENVIMKKRGDINELYLKKREYMLLYPELTSPEEHNISKWKHFLPPIVKYNVLKTLRNVSSDFKKDFMELIKKGSKEQHTSIYVLKGKIIQFGYGIIESINEIVKEKDTLLKTSSRIPFLENACCNENINATNPIYYFNEQDKNISIYITNANQLTLLLKDAKTLSTAPMFYHPDFTGINYPTVSTDYSEENIYASIIHYCNFDRELPVPEELKVIISEKPAEYNPKWSILEKMEFLKRNGKRFSVDHLHQLMSIVREKNIVSVDYSNYFTQIDTFKDVLERLDITSSTVIEEPLRRHIGAVLNSFSPNTMSNELSPEMKTLNGYLLTINQNLYNEIMGFFDSHGNLTNNEYEKLHNFLSKIRKWDLDESITETGLYTITQFIKNAIHSMSKLYPNILLNNAGFYKKVPKHWGLSQFHTTDVTNIITSYYQKIEKFKEDKILLRLLLEIDTKLLDINLFVENIPIQSEIVKMLDGENVKFHSIFDKTTIYRLYSYCFYSTIHEYIVSSYDINLLRMDLNEYRVSRRETINNISNVSNRIGTELNNLEQTTIERDNDYQEVQIETGNLLELKERVCNLLLTFLDVERENKSTIDYTYDEIIRLTNRSKQTEKEGIIKYLGDMSIEERKVEDMFKNYRIGRWNVGQQTGLIEYDKDTYDRERNELLQQLYENGGEDMTTEMVREINDIDIDDLEYNDIEEDDIYDRPDAGIMDLGENYMDGEYYEEDRDENDFGDE